MGHRLTFFILADVYVFLLEVMGSLVLQYSPALRGVVLRVQAAEFGVCFPYLLGLHW